MGTVQENILFGKVFEENRFWQVIKACALDEDLATMPLKEKTLVGEKGLKLSGGQKARINLARALYADADIYLLDDPISALDTKVAKHVVQKCILEYLQNKTVLVVTHQVQFIPKQSSVLILNKHGAQEQLVRHDEEKRQHLDDVLIKEYCGEDYEGEGVPLNEALNEEVDNEEIQDNTLQTTNKSRPYQAYFQSGFHWFTILVILVSIIVSQALSQGCDFLLSKWYKF